MGRAALRGVQGLAWVEKIPIADIGEGERRSSAHRRGTEHQEVAQLRPQRTEATGTGCRPAPAGSRSVRVGWRSEASQEILSAPSEGFSTPCLILGSSKATTDYRGGAIIYVAP